MRVSRRAPPGQLLSILNLITLGRIRGTATGMPSAPCLRMNAFWVSENLEALIALHCFQAGNHRGKL